MISGEITEREYVAAHQLACRKAQLLILRILIAVALCGLVWCFVVSRKTGFQITYIACFAIIANLVQYRIYVPWKARRLFAQIRHKTSASYAWDDEKLTWSDPQGHASNPWDTFIKARENEQVMILYFNDALYLIVPKRWFSDANDLAAFRTHLTFSH